MKSTPARYLLAACAIITCFSLAACSTLSPQAESQDPGRAVVQSYTEAFNSRDIDTMGNMMHEDIEWLSVTDEGVQIVSVGRDALVNEMEDYFETPNAVTSKLSGWSIAGPYVSTTETVTWTEERGDVQSQSALVVYEITDDNHVRRVWYYPAVEAE